jgi:hypothetical protein
MNMPQDLPAKGFYIHFKHDPNGAPFNYMYEVTGVARNTEDGTLTVLYRPLYKNEWLPPAEYFSRPIEMFTDEVTKDGAAMNRFTQITNPEQILQLDAVRNELYG